MKQHIKMVKEFNAWRRGGDDVLLDDKAYPKRLGEALDEVVKAAEQYELMRTLSVEEFKKLYQENLHGLAPFDDLVDELVRKRK